MKSNELAALAGVTVRTLRHYHQVGVLPEPERMNNGYRIYTVHDLVRLLRIKRLGALGIPLEAMAAVLDPTEDSVEIAATLLDAIELDIDEQLRRLQHQKDLLVGLRNHQSAIDLPPELARFVTLFASMGLPSSAMRMDRDQAILLAHLAGDANLETLATFYERLSAPDVIDQVLRFTRNFAELTDETDPTTVDRFADDFIDSFVAARADTEPTLDVALADESTAQSLFDEYQRSEYNSAQQRVVQRMSVRLLAREAPPGRSGVSSS